MANSMAARLDIGGAEGIDFQLNIIAWTLFRAHKLYKDEYEIHSEVVEAGKFDDVVFSYKDKDNKEQYRFLQAKHVRDEANKSISMEDLKYGNKFNLLKYYESFTKIVDNEKFKGKVEDVILFTNLDINKELEPYLDKVPDKDPIFQFKKVKKNQRQPQCYKLKSTFIATYRNGILRDLSNALFESCSAQGSNKINNFKEYHGILMKDVYDVEQKQFRSDFIERKGLSAVTEIFHDLLVKKIVTVASDPKVWMRNATISSFAKLETRGGKWPPIFDMDSNTISFNDFCDKFILAVNQPNESELHNILTAENELKVDIIELRDELRVWFKDYNYPLNDDFINELVSCKELNKIKRELAEQQIEFRVNSLQTELKDFLSHKEQKILQIRTSTDIKATSIKLRCSLMQQSMNNYVFLSTDNESELKRILELFSKSRRYDLLLWETHHCPLHLDLLKDIDIRKQEAKQIIIVCDNILQLSAADAGVEEKFIRRIDDETKYDQLTDATIAKLKRKMMEFQGEMIRLNLIYSFDHFSLDSTDMSWTHLAQKDIVVGVKPNVAAEYKIENYIHRTMTMDPYFDKSEILQERHQLHFVITEKDFEDELKDQEKQHPEKIVHLFKDVNDKFVWQKSTTGGLKQLEKLNLKTITKPIDDNKKYLINAIDACQKVFILTDPAGMGKTVTSSHLATELKRQNPIDWVVRLVAMECARTLSQIKDPRQLDESSILKQLMNLKSPLEEFTFGQYLSDVRSKSKLIMIFDGYDEINEELQGIILRVLKHLSEKPNVRFIGITTRPHHKDQLQDEFQQIAFTLVPFTEENKLDFLVKFWNLKIKPGATLDNGLRTFAKELIHNLTKSISDKDSELTGIPLQMRMLGEIYEDDAKEYLENGSIVALDAQPLDLYSMYEQFIQKKKGIFMQDKLKAVGSSKEEDIMNSDRKIIIRYAKQIILNGEEVSDEELDETIYLGIVQKYGEGSYNFIHRTFAEFLTAQHILDDLILNVKLSLKEKLEKSNFIDVLTNKNLGIVRQFINCRLKHDDKILNQFTNILTNQLVVKEYFAETWNIILDLPLEEATNEITFFILDLYWFCDSEKMREYLYSLFVYISHPPSLNGLINCVIEKREKYQFDYKSLLKMFRKIVDNSDKRFKDNEYVDVVIRFHDKLEVIGALHYNEFKNIVEELNIPRILSSLQYLTYLQSKPNNYLYELMRDTEILTKHDEFYSDIELRDFLSTLGDDPVFISQYFDDVFLDRFNKYFKSSKGYIYIEFICNKLRTFTSDQMEIFKCQLCNLNINLWQYSRNSNTFLQFCDNNRDILPFQNILDAMKIGANLSLIEHCALWGHRDTLRFILDNGDEIETPPIELIRSDNLSAETTALINHTISRCSIDEFCEILTKDYQHFRKLYPDYEFKSTTCFIKHAITNNDSIRLDIFASFFENEDIFVKIMSKTNDEDIELFLKFTVERLPQFKVKFFEIKITQIIKMYTKMMEREITIFDILEKDESLNEDELLQICRLKGDATGDTILHLAMIELYPIDQLETLLNLFKNKCTNPDDISKLFQIKNSEGETAIDILRCNKDNYFKKEIASLFSTFFSHYNLNELAQECKKIQLEFNK